MAVTPLPTTRDTLLEGALVLHQPARGHGYRFNLDPVLLSGFVRPAVSVMDLGAGCGVLGLLLLARGVAQRLTAVELVPEVARLIEQNARANAWAERVRVVVANVRALEDEPRCDAVVMNPPYFRVDEGAGAPERARDGARHERHATLAEFVACGLRHLQPEGALYAVLPTARRTDLEAALEQHDAAVVRLRGVHAREGKPARLMLIEARRGAARADLVREAPLYVHPSGTGRGFTDEVAALLARSSLSPVGDAPRE